MLCTLHTGMKGLNTKDNSTMNYEPACFIQAIEHHLVTMRHPLPLLCLVALTWVHRYECQPTQEEVVRSPEDGRLGIMLSYVK